VVVEGNVIFAFGKMEVAITEPAYVALQQTRFPLGAAASRVLSGETLVDVNATYDAVSGLTVRWARTRVFVVPPDGILWVAWDETEDEDG
jgi:hypothetical protein